MAANRRAALLLAAALGAFCAVAYAQALPEPKVVRLNDRVHILLGPIQHANAANQGYMINSAVIVGDRGVIVVDSGGSDEVGRHIHAAVRKITDKPVTHVVNTHHHGDHSLGNTAFAAATVMSSEACRRLVSETGAEWVAIMEQDVGRKLPGTRPVPASVTFTEGRALQTINGVRVEFWVPKGSHTGGDMMVLLPDDKVLIAGDILVSGVVPTLRDGFLGNWIQTLESILATNVERFVPGHGNAMSRAEVIALRDGLARFRAQVKAGYRAGKTEAEIRKTLDPAWEKLERAYVIGRNVNRAYLEAEAESFDDPK